MSTSTLVGNLAKIRDIGDQAELDNRSLQAHMNFGMTMAGYANSYAQNQMKEKITFARSTSETPEEFNLKLDQIRKDNPVLGKLAARQIERGKVEAEVMDYQRQVKLQKMAEDGFFSSLTGIAPTFDSFDSFSSYHNEAVSKYQKEHPNTSADFTLKADQVLNSIQNSFRNRSQAANLKTLGNFAGTIMADLPQNITLGAAQKIYTDVLDQSKAIFGNVVGEQKARNAIKSQLEYTTNPQLINRFYEAGILTDRDSKVLKAQANNRVAANKRSSRSLYEDYETEVYNNSVRIGFVSGGVNDSGGDFLNEAYRQANEVMLNNQETMQKSVMEALVDIMNMPNSNTKQVLFDAIMQRQEMIRRDPITYYSLMKGLDQDSLDVINSFVPIKMDNDNHVLDKTEHLENIAARLDAVKNVQYGSGIQVEAIFNPEQASQNTDQFNRLSSNDKNSLIVDYTALIKEKGMNKKILDNLTGDVNYRTYADLQKLKDANANTFLNGYLFSQIKDNFKSAENKYAASNQGIRNLFTFTPLESTQSDMVKLASTYLMAININNKSKEIDAGTALDVASTTNRQNFLGNTDLIFLKGTQSKLEAVIVKDPALDGFFKKDKGWFKKGKNRNLDTLRNNYRVEQIDFTTFKVYSPQGSGLPPVTLFIGDTK